MQQEVEAKFLNIDHAQIREKLKSLGAECECSTRVMRRVMLDHADDRYQEAIKSANNKSERLRIRDEGHKTTITYKKQSDTSYSYEIEIEADDFDEALKLFEAIGFKVYSYQEQRREEWQIDGTEIVLDEWPWLSPFIEIEGKDEESIKSLAKKLGLDWSNAKFGSVDTAYMSQYPKMNERESIGSLSEVKFGTPLPQFLKDRL